MLDYKKNSDGLVPAIIQDANTGKVLMLGYMNEEAYNKTVAEKKVHSGAAHDSASGQRARQAATSSM